MKNKHCHAGLAGVLALAVLPSAHADDEAPGLLDRLETWKVQIRKSFTGTAEEPGLPASVTYENPDSGPDYYSVDIGIKTGQFPPKDDWDIGDRLAARIYPTFEIHRSNKENSKVRNTSGGLTYAMDWALGPESDALAKAILFDIKADLGRDSIQKQTTRTLALRVTGYDIQKRWTPGADIVFGGASLSWLPTIGLEDYRKIAITEEVNGETVVVANAVNASVAFGRLSAELRPFRGTLNSKLVITATHTVRNRIGGDAALGKTTRLFEGAVDLYLDAENRFSFGLSYQNGEDPKRNFLDEESSSLGFKLKL